MPRRPQLPSFVGYTRVSTLKQSYEGLSLEGQQDAIKSYARVVGKGLVALHEDIKSGAGDPMLRPDFRDALKNAEQLKCPILVKSVDRLGRDLRVYNVLVERHIPVWVYGEGKITRRELKSRLCAARDWLLQRSIQAASAQANKSPAQRKKSVPDLPDARRRGALKNMGRAAERDMKTFSVLDANPDFVSIARKDLAAILNKRRQFNIVDQSGRERDWTARSVGGLRQRYQEHLREQSDLDESEA